MLEFFAQYGYIGLFTTSFLAATILPVSSEFLFGTMILTGFNEWGCIIAASIGNWLGGMTNYYLGRLGKIEWATKHLKINQKKMAKIQNWISRKGAIMAFFSFLPGIGDLIAFALGYMRANVYIVNVTMFLGKFIRYVFLAYSLSYGKELFQF